MHSFFKKVLCGALCGVPFQICTQQDVTRQDKGVILDMVSPFLGPLKDQIKNDQYAIQHNPYQHEVAYVRCGNSPLPLEELEWQQLRFEKVKKAQERFLGMALADDEVLSIGMALSGGGYRAMISSVGSMAAAERTGLLDCVMTVAGLSGSTWFIGPWITSGMKVVDYKDRILSLLDTGLELKTPYDIKHLFDALLVKFAYNQHITLVDAYGTLLANALLRMCGENCQHTYLATDLCPNAPSHVSRIASANVPFPVYTAVLADEQYNHEIFEFTPYEVGSRWWRSYVPSWAFGREFADGSSVDNAPEQPLGYIMGTAGSAFAVSCEDVYEVIIKEKVQNPLAKTALDYIFSSDVGSLRVSWAQVYNYTFGMEYSPLSTQKNIRLYDAGVIFGVPFFATYRKAPNGDAPDIILAFDYSSTVGAAELVNPANYARKHGLPFPCVDNPESGNQVITVFDDNDLDVPVVVYMPRIKDQQLLEEYRNDIRFYGFYDKLAGLNVDKAVGLLGYANILNFYYSKYQAEQWAALTEFNLLSQINVIRQVMKDRVLAKRASK